RSLGCVRLRIVYRATTLASDGERGLVRMIDRSLDASTTCSTDGAVLKGFIDEVRGRAAQHALEAAGRWSLSRKRSVVPLAGHGLRPPPLRWRAGRPQLKRDPLGRA